MAKTRGCTLGIRIDCDLKKALERAAAQDGRTISNYVEQVLIAHIKKAEKSR